MRSAVKHVLLENDRGSMVLRIVAAIIGATAIVTCYLVGWIRFILWWESSPAGGLLGKLAEAILVLVVGSAGAVLLVAAMKTWRDAGSRVSGGREQSPISGQAGSQLFLALEVLLRVTTGIAGASAGAVSLFGGGCILLFATLSGNRDFDGQSVLRVPQLVFLLLLAAGAASFVWAIWPLRNVGLGKGPVQPAESESSALQDHSGDRPRSEGN